MPMRFFQRLRREAVIFGLLVVVATGVHTFRHELGLTETSLQGLQLSQYPYPYPYTSPPTIGKAFGSATVPVNGTTTLVFTVTNPNPGTGLTGVSFTDSLPAGLVVANPSGLASTCGGTATAAPGSGVVSLSGGVLAPGSACTVTANVFAVEAGTKVNVSSVVTSVEGGAGNTATATLEVTRASPTITTQASPGGLLGAPVRDVATLSGTTTPTGTVTFRLFSDATCTTQVFTSTKPIGGTTATSDWFTPGAAGTYRWTAVYSGDAANNPATSPCNAPNESVTIAPFQAPPCTRTLTGDVVGPITVRSGESVCITAARVVGPVTVNPGGALTVADSQISGGVVATSPSFFSLCGSQVSGPSPATALSVTDAGVPIRIGDLATGCAGNRFAGTVAVNGNFAVTFGSNIVSHNTVINDNGPGNTVIKANTFFSTLSCSGNNPPPTNAGQPNTGTKTGQCGAL